MNKRQRGRPKLDYDATKLPNIRLSPEQLQSYRDAADKKDVTLSEWVRVTLDRTAKRELKQ